MPIPDYSTPKKFERANPNDLERATTRVLYRIAVACALFPLVFNTIAMGIYIPFHISFMVIISGYSWPLQALVALLGLVLLIVVTWRDRQLRRIGAKPGVSTPRLLLEYGFWIANIAVDVGGFIYLAYEATADL